MKLTKINYKENGRIISQFFNCEFETAKLKNEWLNDVEVISEENDIYIKLTEKDYFNNGGMLCIKDSQQNPNEENIFNVHFNINATSL